MTQFLSKEPLAPSPSPCAATNLNQQNATVPAPEITRDWNPEQVAHQFPTDSFKNPPAPREAMGQTKITGRTPDGAPIHVTVDAEPVGD
jgi:hypothetical protein